MLLSPGQIHENPFAKHILDDFGFERLRNHFCIIRPNCVIGVTVPLSSF